ncbi:MAG: hydantoinase/oxoprolinase family protein [Terriglobales bacterium]
MAPRSPAPPARVAVDTGGTFTDCVWIDQGGLRVLKLPSTPQDPGQALLDALRHIGAGAGEIRHGTTVGTNALLERSGARVAFVTTAGFEDTIAIGRQARPELFRWSYPAPAPLAPEPLRFGVPERIGPGGGVLRAPSRNELARLAAAVRVAAPEAIAVSLLFSFANPAHERAVAKALQPLGLPLSLSHRILPEFREYERGTAVLINAYLAPTMGRYLQRLDQHLRRRSHPARLSVMQSSGGIIGAQVAAREPVRTILSGPAGGVVGAWEVARRAGFDHVLSFDMGGTSTDVALVAPGGPRTTHEAQVLGMPVSIPMLDIHTVGAGGGSLARFDAGGALQVGPESAGADPGPICYGRGEQPTVTDANLVLGRLDAAGLLGGGMRLDLERTRRMMAGAKGSVRTLEAFADGIARLAEATMQKALRVISVERGFDPREFTLVAFGGAGPLHACALAAELEIPRVLVPPLPGALSALGILMSDVVRDYSRTVMLPLGAGLGPRLQPVFRQLERQGRQDLRGRRARLRAERLVDLRYAGQGSELTLPAGANLAARFHRLHRQRYGYADPQRPMEIVSVRVRLVAPSPPLPWTRQRERRRTGRAARQGVRPVWFHGRLRPTAVFGRDLLRPGDRFAGPAIIDEYSATTVLPPGWGARVDGWGNLILEPQA